MRKFVCLFAVLALAAPVFAANVVTLSVTDADNGQVLITYDSTGSDDVPVGMGIKISMTNGATVNSTGDILETNAEFNTNIDFIVDMAEPNTYDPTAPVGDPLADPDAAGRATLPASVVSVSAGRLTDPPTGAAVAGTVIKLQLNDNGASDTVVTAEADLKRGGVVGSTFTVVPASATVTFGVDCWSFACQPCGDCTGDALISPADATVLVNAWSPKPYDKCADFNRDGIISPADATVLVNHWSPKPNCPATDGCQ